MVVVIGDWGGLVVVVLLVGDNGDVFELNEALEGG